MPSCLPKAHFIYSRHITGSWRGGAGLCFCLQTVTKPVNALMPLFDLLPLVSRAAARRPGRGEGVITVSYSNGSDRALISPARLVCTVTANRCTPAHFTTPSLPPLPPT